MQRSYAPSLAWLFFLCLRSNIEEIVLGNQGEG